jgi:hypothetical protein
MKKTRWVLGVGYPERDAWGSAVYMNRTKENYSGDGEYIHCSDRIPKSALTGKDKYRLVLEKVEPKAAE